MSSNKNNFKLLRYNLSVLKISLLKSSIAIFALTLSTLNCSIFKVDAQEKTSLISETWWDFQSIDTMKTSRDLAREKLNDPSFDAVIDMQVKNIAATGATHVAIATPYDKEFIPFLKRWVEAARKNNLSIWFRGNWSGWEGWFDYPKISREEHIKKTVEFIKNNSELFEPGDVFTACPECENGGSGDPRSNGDAEGHRKFLIEEYKQVSNAYRNLGKSVRSNFNPMNADVAKLIMDKETTKSLGGLVVIDHYIATPEKLAQDIVEIAKMSGGKIVLGEFGAPIPDIHGRFTEEQQAAWIDRALHEIAPLEELVGLNYWVNTGGTTEIWSNNGTPRKAVEKITSYFKPLIGYGKVVNTIAKPIVNATIRIDETIAKTDKKGEFSIKYIDPNSTVYISADNYKNSIVSLPKDTYKVYVLEKTHENIFYRIQKFFYNLFKK